MTLETITTVLAGLAFFVIPAGQLIQVRKSYLSTSNDLSLSVRKELGHVARWIPWCLFALFSDPKWAFLLYGRWAALALSVVIILQVYRPHTKLVALWLVGLLSTIALGASGLGIWHSRELLFGDTLPHLATTAQVVIILAFIWNIIDTNRAQLKKARLEGTDDMSASYALALVINFSCSLLYGVVHQEWWFAAIYGVVLFQELRILREIIRPS